MSSWTALIAVAENFHGIARLPRLLSEAGARVEALVPRRSNLGDSSFVSARIAGSSDPDEALDRLRAALEAAPRDWVIFGDDLILDRAVARRAEPWLTPLLPLRGKPEAAEALISKVAFSRAMSAAGVPMAPSRAAATAAEIRAAAGALGLPVIVKPDRGFAGVGLFTAATPGELERGLRDARGAYIVERLIAGRMGATPVLYDGGRPAWWSSFRNEGVYPAPFGPSCRRLAFEPPGLEPVLERLGAALGLHGLFGIDWMLTPGGELFVIELNGRPIQMAGSSAHVREGLPAALRDFHEGRFAVRRPPAQERAGVLHAMPASFLLALDEGSWGLAAGLLCGLSGSTDVPWGDFGLLKNHAVRTVKTLIRTFAIRFYGRLPGFLRSALDPAVAAVMRVWRRR